MFDKTAFVTFLVAALALNLAPGPDMLYVLGRTLGQGRKAGVVSSLGIFAGCLAHIAAAALGVAALLKSSPVAFNVVRYAGAAYLMYLGIRVLASKASALENTNAVLKTERLDRIFYQGAITNVLNPKVAVFFLAFLPQFVNAKSGSVALQIVILGLVFNAGGTLVNLIVASAAGHLGDRLRRAPRIARIQKWITGTIFIGLGLRLGLARR
ncbi:MAG TPA: LysE family translocator [Verrucomicrobiae bacterium]|jgi:threonine/homoserine/homoserine lactone efflux protein|nr:LysE family translocator [Verrucomicrobiae bacterium]